MPKPNGLRREERLRSRTSVNLLFGGGSYNITAFPLRAVFRENEEQINRILVSVPKRHLHHAVDRNHIKRQIREAYRLNKNLLTKGSHYDVAFLWLTGNMIPSVEVVKRVTTLLQKINERNQ